MSPAPAKRTRILVCAFGPFPGVAVNPSERLARAVLRARRPALADAELCLSILPTAWASLAHLDATLERVRPDAVLLMGVATRRRAVDLEGWAVNAARAAPDVDRRRPAATRLVPGAPPALASTAALGPLAAAMRQHRVPVRRSRDAGRYLCNAAYFHTLYHAQARARAMPVVFVHLPGRDGRPQGTGTARMVRGLSTLLAALAAQARRSN